MGSLLAQAAIFSEAFRRSSERRATAFRTKLSAEFLVLPFLDRCWEVVVPL